MSLMKRTIVACIALGIAASAASVAPTRNAAAAGAAIDVAAWVAHWPVEFTVWGGKSEPTYVEAIDIERLGDVFTARGGAPAWERRATESITVEASGRMRHLRCAAGMSCADAAPGVSFLSSAALLAAFRAHRPLGRATPMPYGDREILCLPAERLGIKEAVLDPCFDLETGAVLAQRHRLSGRIDGPSLDPGSIHVTVGATGRGDARGNPRDGRS
jgi:hypothetical protein